MSQEVKRRRGTTAQHTVFAGAIGELTVDTDKHVVVVHDGTQLGGYPMAPEDALIVSAGTSTARLHSVVFLDSPTVSFGLSGSTITASAAGGGGGGGVVLKAGANSITSGTAQFSNSNGISIGIAGQTITFSHNGITSQSNQDLSLYALGNTTQNSSAVINASVFSLNGLGGVTVGYSNGSIQISGATGGGGGGGIAGIQASNTTLTSGTVTFQNANGISFGSSGANGISASYTVPTQTVQPVAISGSNGSFAFSTVTLGNLNGLSFYSSNGSIVGSYTTPPPQSNQTVGLYALGNTTQNSSTTLDARSMSFNGLGIVTVGYSNGSIQLSATVAAQTNQTVGMYAVGNTTQNSSTTLDARTLSFGGRGDITVGYSNGTVQISGNQTAQTVGLYALGNTTQNSSTTLDARTLSFNGLGLVTVGYSNGSIQLSAGMYLSDPNGSEIVTRLAFTNLNGVTLSLLTGIGNSATIVGSVAQQSNQTLGIYASSNTTGDNSTGTHDARSLTIVGKGIASVGWSNGSLLLSVPSGGGGGDGVNIIAAGTQTAATTGTVLFQNSNGVTFGMSNSSVVTASIVTIPPSVYFEPKMRGATSTQSLANGTVYFQPFHPEEWMTLNRLQMLQQVTTQATTTMTAGQIIFSTPPSSNTGTGSGGTSGTILLYSRLSTGTNANSSQIVSFFSTTYTYSMGISQTGSWTTNVSSATGSYTTSCAIGYIQNVGSDGAVTTSSYGESGSGTSSSTSNAAGTSTYSTAMTFLSKVMSGVRPIFLGFATSLNPGDYWLAHIRSTATGSAISSFGRVCRVDPGIVFYTSNTSGYVEIGATASTNNSNVEDGWGSYSSSGNTTITSGIPVSQISNMSQFQTWFNMLYGVR